ncbi:MAG: DUF5313 family protein [Gordonia sp. (in: high G+C Gram-positive bacteria)]|uniref:DUF5313 family protein n=1 Tax=Gordonia sp. (in: high G+C Gram-positive bacteria) TaxID=84139 RepID=UPI0039E4C03F
MSDTRPGPAQRLGYLLGRPLPDSMQDWVQRDITGPGNARRYLIRGLVPFVPVAVGLAFVPGPWFIRVLMILLLLIPLVYFQIALKDVYRRHLLRNNGLDPKLADKQKIERIDSARDDFERRYRRLP